MVAGSGTGIIWLLSFLCASPSDPWVFIRSAENLRRKQGQDEHQKRDSLHVSRSPDNANGSTREA